MALHKQGDLKAAVAEYSEAIRLDPASEDAWDCRGLALRELGRPEQATADFAEAARLDPAYAAEAWKGLKTAH